MPTPQPLTKEELSPFLAWFTSRHLRRSGVSPSETTLKAKRSRLSAIARRLEAHDHRDLATLIQSRSVVQDLLHRLSVEVTPATSSQAIRALVDFAEYAVEAGLVPHTAISSEDIPRNVRQNPVVEVYSPGEVEAIVAAARGRDLRLWGLLATLADTGRRIGEVLGMRYDQLKLEHQPPHVILPMTKSGRPQVFPLTKRLTEQVFTEPNIARWKRGHRISMYRYKRDPEVYPFPWSYQSAQAGMKRVCTIAGLPHRGFHNFRHAKATHLLSEGVPIEAVSSLLGHESVATTDRVYRHTSPLGYAKYLEGDWAPTP